MKNIFKRIKNALNLRNKTLPNNKPVPYHIHKEKLDYIVELETELTEIKHKYNQILLDLAAIDKRWEKRFADFMQHHAENRKIDDYQIASLMLHSNMPKNKKEKLKEEIHEMKHKLIFYRWDINGEST